MSDKTTVVTIPEEDMEKIKKHYDKYYFNDGIAYNQMFVLCVLEDIKKKEINK